MVIVMIAVVTGDSSSSPWMEGPDDEKVDFIRRQ